MSDNINGQKLKINEYSLNNMVPNPSIVIVAKRGSGKTVVCGALIEQFKSIPVGIIISATEELDPFYKYFFPDSFIYKEYSSTLFDKILARQSYLKKKLEQKQAQGKTFDARLLLIMDDCLASSKTWAHDESIREILMNGRHYNITYILTMQFPLGIGPELRSQFDYVFLMYEDKISNLKRLYEHYAGVFPTFLSFREIFGQLTENFGSMLLVIRGAQKEFSEKVFFYKAPFNDPKINPPKMFGCEEVVKYHIKNYDKNWFERSRGLNIADFCDKKKREKGNIKVEKVNIGDNKHKKSNRNIITPQYENMKI